MFSRTLLAPDGTGSGPETPNGDPPSSPKIVKKTPGIKTPREIQLEKQLSTLEDRIGSLETGFDGINSFLADAFPTGKKPSGGTPAPEKGFLDEFNDFILGKG